MDDKLYAYIGKLYVQNQELAKFAHKIQEEAIKAKEEVKADDSNCNDKGC